MDNKKRLTDLLTYRALDLKLSISKDHPSSDFLVDAIDSPLLKNVCAKVSIDLANRLDEAVSILQISKRQFIEFALLSALDEYERVIDEVGVFPSEDKSQNETCPRCEADN